MKSSQHQIVNMVVTMNITAQINQNSFFWMVPVVADDIEEQQCRSDTPFAVITSIRHNMRSRGNKDPTKIKAFGDLYVQTSMGKKFNIKFSSKKITVIGVKSIDDAILGGEIFAKFIELSEIRRRTLLANCEPSVDKDETYIEALNTPVYDSGAEVRSEGHYVANGVYTFRLFVDGPRVIDLVKLTYIFQSAGCKTSFHNITSGKTIKIWIDIDGVLNKFCIRSAGNVSHTCSGSPENANKAFLEFMRLTSEYKCTEEKTTISEEGMKFVEYSFQIC